MPARRHAAPVLTLAVLVLATFVSAAHAQSWSEVGDAGDLVSTAQATIGNGPLTSIAGNLTSPQDVDIYCVDIPTVPPAGLPLAQLQCVVMTGPNVWLFDANGVGVFTNQTCASGAKTILAPNVSLPAGTYYLAVSFTGVDPVSAGGPIWLDAPGQRAPDGPGSAGTLTGWTGTGFVQQINPYTVYLAGMTFCSAATPVHRGSWGSLKSIYR